jgi:hypothetical protein
MTTVELRREVAAIAQAVRDAVTPIWYDHETIAIRCQRNGELRTKVGSRLRPSCHWDEDRKTRKQMVGTAGWLLHSLEPRDIEQVVERMMGWGFACAGDRLVLIGTDGSAWGEGMSEPGASALVDAKLLAIVGTIGE